MRLHPGGVEAFHHLRDREMECLAFAGQQSLADGLLREGVAEGHLLG